jgi:hypothetical protein
MHVKIKSYNYIYLVETADFNNNLLITTSHLKNVTLGASKGLYLESTRLFGRKKRFLTSSRHLHHHASAGVSSGRATQYF